MPDKSPSAPHNGSKKKKNGHSALTAATGLACPRDPRQGSARGGPPSQQQDWPGSDAELEPRADHGERSYRGAGRLIGLKALVTGGDSGIGRAIAIAFAREGADVAIAYVAGDEEEDARETARWIEEAGRKAVLLPGDLAEHACCLDTVRGAVAGLGGLDILVNNAGTHFECDDVTKITPEQLDRTVRTNLYATFWLIQAALEHLPPGGCIINTGSVTALEGHVELVDYAATKSAIHNLTRSLAQQLAERGIRINCVAPGPVHTPLIPATRSRESTADHGASTLWKRPAQPIEIATSYVFLASSDARFFTGELLCPSGTPTTTR